MRGFNDYFKPTKKEIQKEFDKEVIIPDVPAPEPEPQITEVTTIVQGTPGADGVAGIKGRDGLPGLPGNKGGRGEQGSHGLPGEQGLPGEPGLPGEQGLPGEPGLDGIPGEQGQHGEKGDAGENGQNGKDGVDGRDGVDGTNGKDGVDGKDGNDGVDGKDGERGESGIAGPVGSKGERGDRGTDGARGEQGNLGEKGDPGLDGKDAVKRAKFPLKLEDNGILTFDKKSLDLLLQAGSGQNPPDYAAVNDWLAASGGAVGIQKDKAQLIKSVNDINFSGQQFSVQTKGKNIEISVDNVPRVYASENDPTGATAAQVGDFWFKSTTGKLYVRYESAWVEPQ